MQHSLSRYLVIYTVAQLPMLVIAAFFPYIFSMDTSPNLRALLRVLLDYEDLEPEGLLAGND